MFQWLVIGRLLCKGMSLYEQNDYYHAAKTMDKVLEIDDSNFIANVVRFQTSVVLGDLDNVIKYKIKCETLHPYLSEIVLTPWQDTIQHMKKGDNPAEREIQHLNEITEDNLRELQEHKFTFADVFIFPLIFIPIISVTFALIPRAGDLLLNLASIICLLLWVLYSSRKSTLVMNPYTYLSATKDKLFYSHKFVIITFAIVLTYLMLPPSLGITIKDSVFQFLFTVITIVYLNGVIFSLVKRYNKILAYVIVAILVLLIQHGFTLYFVSYLLYSFLYEETKTIVAPIVLAALLGLVSLLISALYPLIV